MSAEREAKGGRASLSGGGRSPKVDVSLSSEEREAFAAEAERCDRSLSAMVRILAREGLRERELQRRAGP